MGPANSLPAPARNGDAMKRLIRSIATLFAIVAALCIVAMMGMTVADVATRALTGRSVPGAQEISEQLVVALVFLGMAFAYHRHEHVAVTICTRALPVRPRASVRLLGRAILLALVGWMIWATGQGAWHAYVRGEIRFGLLQVPVWPARAAIPIGLAAFALSILSDMADRIRDLIAGRDDSAEPNEGYF
ncbi:MAG: TRAP-type C4-dicarboxylate transport system, small permease component [Rhodobacteraceae bacterium HLUCCA12]|nr:MAG: TRAP-type C4-dicarboxylate transport system, small permease component [Rhodobacteraceae bacterium HLUCCA12]